MDRMDLLKISLTLAQLEGQIGEPSNIANNCTTCEQNGCQMMKLTSFVLEYPNYLHQNQFFSCFQMGSNPQQ